MRVNRTSFTETHGVVGYAMTGVVLHIFAVASKTTSCVCSDLQNWEGKPDKFVTWQNRIAKLILFRREYFWVLNIRNLESSYTSICFSAYMHAYMCMLGVRGFLVFFVSFCLVFVSLSCVPGIKTQDIILSSKHLYPLSHLSPVPPSLSSLR